MSNSLSILDMCCVGMVLDFVDGLFPHVGIGFDPNHQLGSLTPDRGGQSGPAAQIHHQGGMRQVNQLRQQIEQSWWRRRTRPIVAAGFASPNITGFCHAVFSFLASCDTPHGLKTGGYDNDSIKNGPFDNNWQVITPKSPSLLKKSTDEFLRMRTNVFYCQIAANWSH